MKSLMKRMSGRAEERRPPPRPRHPVVVIGDVHGRADLLERLLPQLDDRAAWVFVGDLIDRGEDSAAVLARVMELQTEAPEIVYCLMGNHERMLLDFLDDPASAAPVWLPNGGLQTLASFGVGGISVNAKGAALERAARELRSRMPVGTAEWLAERDLIWRSGSLAVVHAAADPATALDKQKPRTLLWGSPEFLNRGRDDECWVAHGHTVVDAPRLGQSRISVDTGAYFTGRLTAATILPDGSVSFQST